MATYIDDRNIAVKARNYQEAAEKLYGQSKGCKGQPTTYIYRHNGYADVKVYTEGAKIGTYYGVVADIPVIHTLKRVKE